MKTITIKSPYNDAKLEFNNETGRYELTLRYVKANFEITFKDDETVKRRISQTSRKIYTFITTRANTYNREVIDFMLNHTEQGRKFLLDVLTEQMEADLESGYNSLSKIAPIDVNNGGVIDRNVIRLNKICVDAEDLIDSSATYFGFPLLYQGVLPTQYFLLVKAGQQNG